MKRAALIFALLLITAGVAFAATPAKYLKNDINWAQLQDMEALGLQQGASLRLYIQARLDGSYLDLGGLTARWEGRSVMDTNVTFQALSSATDNTAHTITIDLDNTQTGTPVTNWVYSVILISDGQDYPIGTGRLDIAASGFTGEPAVVVSNATAVVTYTIGGVDYTDIETIITPTGTTQDDNGTLTLPAPETGEGDMVGASNLSDVASASTSRDNLGLGTAAVEDATAFVQDGDTLGSGLRGPSATYTNQYTTLQDVRNNTAAFRTFFFANSCTSDISPWYCALDQPSESNKTGVVVNNVTNNQYVIGWATDANSPGLTEIQHGVFRVHFHAQKNSNPGALTIKAEAYVISAAGVEIFEIDDTPQTGFLTTIESNYDLDIVLPTNTTTLVTDRWLIKLKATVTSGTPDITIFTEGSSQSFLQGSAGISAEIDPIWAAVSNAVTAGASLGETSLQPTNTAGYIHGAWGDYASSTSVTFREGDGYCNGSYWKITTATLHAMTSLMSGEDLHYLYIDDDASSYPTPTIIDSTTEPTQTASGWYNGDDRCIDVVFSVAGAATITDYTKGKDGRIKMRGPWGYAVDGRINIASAMNPNGAWQTPDEMESSTVLPVMANSALTYVSGGDCAANGSVGATAKETADAGCWVLGGDIAILGYSSFSGGNWLILGPSRNIRITGDNNDDNGLYCSLLGWTINR